MDVSVIRVLNLPTQDVKWELLIGEVKVSDELQVSETFQKVSIELPPSTLVVRIAIKEVSNQNVHYADIQVQGYPPGERCHLFLPLFPDLTLRTGGTQTGQVEVQIKKHSKLEDSIHKLTDFPSEQPTKMYLIIAGMILLGAILINTRKQTQPKI